MVLFMILGSVVLITFAVLGVLFFLLNKEGKKDESYKKRSQELGEEIRTITLKADGQSNEARHRIEALTKDNESLKSQQADLQTQLESAHATAQSLLSAPKADPDEALRHELESLKYELIKARAQSSGLEKVNLNYKNQLEELVKKDQARAQQKDQ